MKTLSIILILLHGFVLFSQNENIRINEFMANNAATLTDADGDFSDWIEIYNPTTEAIDLTAWSLTDDKNNTEKWKFPNTILQANSYLIVFASGKNYAVSEQELHTNFSLSKSGEYLALYNALQLAVSIFDPTYPEQEDDISYAYNTDGNFYITTPTPGAENQFTNSEYLNAPVFSVKHGFFYAPFKTAINTAQTASIYYTTDGSTPSENHGILYTDSILITTTTPLRAIALNAENLKIQVASQTYIFTDSVKKQPNNPAGYPAIWGRYTDMDGNAIGDYEMDKEVINDARYTDKIDEALLSIPTISIVTDLGNLFSASANPDSGGIYIFTGPPEENDVPGIGDGWERPASIEYFNTDGSLDYTINCGLRLHGGHSRRAEKTPKHSFRLTFRNEYGGNNFNYPIFGTDVGVAKSFNTFNLRAGYGNTWLHMSNSEQVKCQLIRDLWAKDLQLELGYSASHGNYAHLYLNGLYWGIYNPTERLDKDFAENYLGGKAGDYDVIKDYATVVDGDSKAWFEMFKLARQGLNNNENYQRIQGKNPDGSVNSSYKAYVDVVNLIDYMILNFYGSNWDWDQHNWVAIRNREEAGKGFIFLSWDAEHIIEDVNANNLNVRNSNCPSELFQLFTKNTNFRKLFAEHIDALCFNNGPLTPNACKLRWMKRADQIDMAIIAESARWGDYRRDVHNLYGTTTLYTKEHWLGQMDYILNDYFNNRTEVFINQLEDANLYPFDSTLYVSVLENQTQFGLGQNFPNPFTEFTNITYSISQANNVSIIVYDVYGKVIEQLANNYHEKDSYTVRFSTTNLPAGIYFYKLTVGNKLVETRKMIHVR